MKKHLVFVIFLSVLAVNVNAAENDLNLQNTNTPQFVLCNSDQTRCTLGNYTMRSTGEPLFVNGGILCTADKRVCTNGTSVLHTIESSKRKSK